MVTGSDRTRPSRLSLPSLMEPLDNSYANNHVSASPTHYSSHISDSPFSRHSESNYHNDDRYRSRTSARNYEPSTWLKLIATFSLLLLLCCLDCANGATKPAKPKAIHSDIIEDVDANRLFELVDSEEFLAVFFYTRSCEECQDVLMELEKVPLCLCYLILPPYYANQRVRIRSKNSYNCCAMAESVQSEGIFGGASTV